MGGGGGPGSHDVQHSPVVLQSSQVTTSPAVVIWIKRLSYWEAMVVEIGVMLMLLGDVDADVVVVVTLVHATNLATPGRLLAMLVSLPRAAEADSRNLTRQESGPGVRSPDQ